MKIVILEPIGISLEECQKALPGHEVVEVDSRLWFADQLIEAAKDADVVALSNRPLPGAVIDRLKQLKLIAVSFAGIDHVDADAVQKRNIIVKNAAGYANTAVAELVFGFMLSLARRIPKNNDAVRRMGRTSSGTELKGKTLGIIGFGSIGKEVARLAEAFNMKVVVYDRKNGNTMEDVFAQADFVSLHFPLTPETRGIVTLRHFKLMKPTAFIINTARGPVIDSSDLRTALDGDLIAGAALDVFDTEPPLPEDHPLLHAPNVIATPHIGFNTVEAVARKGQITLNNIVEFVNSGKA